MDDASNTAHLAAISQALEKEGLVVPVVGSGVSNAVAGLPLWSDAISDGLDYAVRLGFPSGNRIKKIRQLLDAGDLLRSAQEVIQLLGGQAGGDFAAWLKERFEVYIRTLPNQDRLVLDRIIDLQCPLIATTNYDTLITQAHPEYFQPTTWQDAALMRTALREGRRVLHLHGVYDRPETVVLGTESYDRLVADPAYRMVLQSLWLEHTLLFIGSSFNGLKDNDFSRFVEWASTTFKGSPYKHYLLLRTESFTMDHVRHFLQEWRVQIVGYGRNYEDLPLWLERINPRLNEARAMRSAHAQIAVAEAGPLLGRSQDLASAAPRLAREIDIPKYIGFMRETINQWQARNTFAPIGDSVSGSEDIESSLVRCESIGLRAATEVSQSPPLLDEPDYYETLSSILEQNRYVSLIGEPGSGKSYAIRQEALLLCRNIEEVHLEDSDRPLRLPVLINLGSYSGAALPEMIRSVFTTAGIYLDIDVIQYLARHGLFTLFLDDYDWAKSQYSSLLLLQVKEFSTNYPLCPLVVTTQRPADARRLEFSTCTLPQLTSAAGGYILSKMGLSKEDITAVMLGQPEEFRDFLNLPLTLQMLAFIYVNSDRSVPRSRSALYQQCIDKLLDRSEGRGHLIIDRSDKVQLLALLAGWMQDTDSYSVSPNELATLLTEWINSPNNRYSVSHLKDENLLLIRAEIIQSELFRVTANNRLEFLHRTIGAYLASLILDTKSLSSLASQRSWYMSVLFWTSRVPITESGVLVELLVNDLLLLGRVIRERNSLRISISAQEITPEPVSYFLNFANFLGQLVGQIQTIQPQHWGFVPEPPLHGLITNSPQGGYSLVWRAGSKDQHEPTIEFLDPKPFADIVRDPSSKILHPVWLFPSDILYKYHPLEAAYMWVMRTLFDILFMIDWQAEPVLNFRKDLEVPPPPPAVVALVKRYMLYSNFARTLPQALTEQLPFYATSGFYLAADVYDLPDREKSLVRYAVLSGVEPGNIKLVYRIHESLQDPSDPVFRQETSGKWSANLTDSVRSVTQWHETGLDKLIDTPTDHDVQDWLRKDLEALLPGFPPERWQL